MLERHPQLENPVGLEYLKNLPLEMLFEICKYLDEKDLRTLKAVAKAFHGRVHVNYDKTLVPSHHWTKKTLAGCFKPIDYLFFKASTVRSTAKSVGYWLLFCAAALPCVTGAAVATPSVFIASKSANGVAKLKEKNRLRQINSHFKPYKDFRIVLPDKNDVCFSRNKKNKP